MRRKHLDFTAWKTEVLKDPKIKAEYDKLKPEYALISALIGARSKKKLTQKDLARKMGTKQSVISRLESGRANPSFEFLKRLARALDSDLKIKFASK